MSVSGRVTGGGLRWSGVLSSPLYPTVIPYPTHPLLPVSLWHSHGFFPIFFFFLLLFLGQSLDVGGKSMELILYRQRCVAEMWTIVYKCVLKACEACRTFGISTSIVSHCHIQCWHRPGSQYSSSPEPNGYTIAIHIYIHINSLYQSLFSLSVSSLCSRWICIQVQVHDCASRFAIQLK